MMKNVTLSADERLIQRAQEKAARYRTTLNQLFRDWLWQYVGPDEMGDDYAALMADLGYVRPGGRLTREQMNES